MPKGRSTPDPTPLHPLEFRILLALARGPSYGTAIVREIEAAEGGRMTLYPANLFRRIRDLLAGELLRESPAPPDADPRRTYLALTARGRETLRVEAERLRSLVREARDRGLLPEP